MFEQRRRELGLVHDDRLVSVESETASVATVIEQRPSSPPESSSLTLGEFYERYLRDPTKRRSARTLLAHETTGRVVQNVLGSNLPLQAITREQCRDLLETLRFGSSI